LSRYLVTSALPYANGPIHFGHAVGAYIPADVYVRTLRMQGEEVLYVCGTDEHGVAITIGAEAEGKDYGEYVAHWRETIKGTFDALGIEFDVWSGTSICPQHAETSQQFFRQLDASGFLLKRETEQLYCTNDEMFLADRYVVGTCPSCGHDPARGDECPSCGSWLDPLQMKSPRCKVCGTTPERRSTRHWYLDLPGLRDEHMGRWIGEHEWKSNVRAFVQNLLEDVPPRAITRDMSWGVPVPKDMSEGETGKVLYVWFDAPIGYVSFTKEWAEREGEDWQRWWKGEDTRLVHFIGKDNIPFHCLVFPSMLHGTRDDYVLPWQVPANEFYNLEGGKFTTSGGWYIPLDEAFEKYDPEALRFHLIASMPETADSEFTWQDFQRTVNSSLADVLGNLATRVLKFIGKNAEGRIPPLHPEHAEELDAILLEECGAVEDPARWVREFRFRKAAEALLANGKVANVFVDRLAPWTLRKEDPAKAESVLNTLCEWIALLARWSHPFMPGKAQQLWEMLGQEGQVAAAGWPSQPEAGSWRSLEVGRQLGEVSGLFQKITDEQVAEEVSALEERARAAGSAD